MAWPPGGPQNDPKEPRRAIWVGHRLEPRPQFHERPPEGNKSDVLGGPVEWGLGEARSCGFGVPWSLGSSGGG